jgi:hypothetical protein
LLSPIRVETPTFTRAAPAGAPRKTSAPRSRLAPSCASVSPSAWASRPGPLATSRSGACCSRPRSNRIRSSPLAGSSARSSTAEARPAASHTTFTQVCMP